MIKKHNKSGLGSILTLIAFVGIIFSIIGIASTWYLRPRIQNSVYMVIDSLDEILNNTVDGLLVLDRALDGAIQNLDIISLTLDNLNTTLESISDSLISSADLIGGDLRMTIIDTQTTLSSAAKSAGLIDNTLRFLAAIPLLGADYRPEVPLSTSLEQVSVSLSDVPDAFLDIEQYIRETEGGIITLQTDLSELSNDIRTYENDLLEAREVISQYDILFGDLRDHLANFRKQTHDFLLITSILSTGGFFLLGIAQISTFQQGKIIKDGDRVTVNLAELQRDK